jgi:DNA-binding transcriptional LysR family regulator
MPEPRGERARPYPLLLILSRATTVRAAMKNKDVTALNWDLVQAFLALERYGRYELASEKENIDDSTLRRRISQLEMSFGRQLFVRSEGGWKVAPDLNDLVTTALRMEDAAKAFFHGQQTGTGDVRISVLDAFALRFGPVFVAFQQKYPYITLNITNEAHFVNLEQEKVDIAIRLARPVRNNNSLRILKIGDVPMNAYASSGYLERMQKDAGSDTPPVHRLLGMRLRFPHQDHSFPYADTGWGDVGLNGETCTWLDSLILLHRMCELGQGVALIPTAFAQGNPDLRLVGDAGRSVNTELWLVSRLDMRAAWQRDLADMLQAELARWPK